MIRFPSPKPGPEGAFGFGPSVYFDPTQVIAIEPKENQYHSFRSAQEYSIVYLVGGANVRVFASSETVNQTVEKALGELVNKMNEHK